MDDNNARDIYTMNPKLQIIGKRSNLSEKSKKKKKGRGLF